MTESSGNNHDERDDDIRPLSDEEIDQIVSGTDFTYTDHQQGVRVSTALHKGFAGDPLVPWDMTLSIGAASKCSSGVYASLVLPAEAARELARTLLRAADMLDRRSEAA
jgi:hypothetical protein